MTSGGTGIDMGDDYVAARLSIDVPSEGIGQVRELTEAVDRFHTSMQAATRSEADMTRYLDQMASSAKRAAEAQANLTNQISMQMSLTQQVSAGGGHSSGVPAGVMQQPFSGATAGTGASGFTPGSRQPNPSDVAYQLQANAQQSQLSHLNFAQARGAADTSSISISPASIGALATQIAQREHAMSTQNVKTGGGQVPRTPPAHHGGAIDPYDQFQARAGAATGMVGNVMNELGSGTGLAGISGMAQHGINALRSHLGQRAKAANAPSSGGGDKGASDPNADGGGEGDGMGGMGGLLKGLGIAGGALGLITGGLALVNKGGAMVQGWRNIGAEVGGGSMEGFRASTAARQMAIDPTVSTDEARSRMQLLMSHGYNKTGALDDPNSQSALKFMSDNYAKYGMDAAHSMQLLDLSAHNSKISIQTLADSMDEMHAAAKNSVLGQDQIQAVALNYAQSMSAQGANPAMALQQGVMASEMFAKDPILAGKMGGTSTQTMNMLERMYGGTNGTPLNIPTGLDPRAIGDYLVDKGMDQEARMNVLMHYAKLARDSKQDVDKNNDTTRRSARAAFAGLLQDGNVLDASDPLKGDKQAIFQLYDTLIWGGGVKKAMDDQKQTHHDATQDQRNTSDRQPGYGGAPSRPGHAGQVAGPNTYGSTTLDRILSTYGNDESQIEVMGPGGQKVGNLDTTNKDMVDKLGSGEYKWRHKGDKGGGISEEDTPEDMHKGDYSTDHPKAKTGVGVNGVMTTSGSAGYGGSGGGNANVQIGLSSEAKRLLQVLGPNPVPLSANDIDANKGQGTAAPNNPPSRDFKFGP